MCLSYVSSDATELEEHFYSEVSKDQNSAASGAVTIAWVRKDMFPFDIARASSDMAGDTLHTP